MLANPEQAGLLMEASAKDVATHYDRYKKLAELQTVSGNKLILFSQKANKLPHNPHSDTPPSILGIKPTPGIDIMAVSKK